MEIEFVVDLYCDEINALAEIQDEYEDIEVEYASGLSGLEIVGSLIIPSLALLLQAISFIKDMKRKKHESITVKKIEVHYDNQIIVIPSDATREEIEETVRRLGQ